MQNALRSPVTGEPLVPVGRNFLRDADGRMWPVLDGIPFLRVGREALVETIVDCLKVGHDAAALAAALSDQDEWWTGPAPAQDALQRLICERDRLSLRAAMDLLGFERVGDYFAHRWTDPTFLSGLAMLEAHWAPATNAFELACGIGQFGRELAQRGVSFTGCDVVFSKLWLARHWVLPADAALVCFDAAAPWPIADHRFDLVFCHDAFYFLEPKAEITAKLRTLAAPGGRIAIGHIHNSEVATLSSGKAVSPATLARMFPDAVFYDDAELTRAFAEGREPRTAAPDALCHVEALSLEDGQMTSARPIVDGLASAKRRATFRLNPLYRPTSEGFEIAWPSDRYRSEYAALATYPLRLSTNDADRAMLGPDADAVRRRIVVDLPERW